MAQTPWEQAAFGKQSMARDIGKSEAPSQQKPITLTPYRRKPGAPLTTTRKGYEGAQPTQTIVRFSGNKYIIEKRIGDTVIGTEEQYLPEGQEFDVEAIKKGITPEMGSLRKVNGEYVLTQEHELERAGGQDLPGVLQHFSKKSGDIPVMSEDMSRTERFIKTYPHAVKEVAKGAVEGSAATLGAAWSLYQTAKDPKKAAAAAAVLSAGTKDIVHKSAAGWKAVLTSEEARAAAATKARQEYQKAKTEVKEVGRIKVISQEEARIKSAQAGKAAHQAGQVAGAAFTIEVGAPLVFKAAKGVAGAASKGVKAIGKKAGLIKAPLPGVGTPGSTTSMTVAGSTTQQSSQLSLVDDVFGKADISDDIVKFEMQTTSPTGQVVRGAGTGTSRGVTLQKPVQIPGQPPIESFGAFQGTIKTEVTKKQLGGILTKKEIVETPAEVFYANTPLVPGTGQKYFEAYASTGKTDKVTREILKVSSKGGKKVQELTRIEAEIPDLVRSAGTVTEINPTMASTGWVSSKGGAGTSIVQRIIKPKPQDTFKITDISGGSQAGLKSGLQSLQQNIVTSPASNIVTKTQVNIPTGTLAAVTPSRQKGQSSTKPKTPEARLRMEPVTSNKQSFAPGSVTLVEKPPTKTGTNALLGIGLRPGQKIRPKQKISTISAVKPKTGAKPGQATSPEALIGAGQIVKPSFMPPPTIVKPDLVTTPDAGKKAMPKPAPVPPTIPVFNIFTPKPPRLPPLPGASLGGAIFGSPGKAATSVSQKNYVPSVSSFLLGFKAPKQKIKKTGLSGLEIRPIPI